MTAWTWQSFSEAMVTWFNTRARRVPVWAVYATGAAFVPYLFYLAVTGGLGVEPINELERVLGRTTLKLLIAGLAVTPLRRYAGLNLMKFRRALGVLAFSYVTVHLLVWLVLDVQIPAQIWADIVKRPYVTIGMAGFVALLPLAVTSNNWSVRRMGAASWRRLHRLVYPAVLLGAVHFIILTKGFPFRPLVYLTIIAVLLLVRVRVGAPLRRVRAD